MPELPEVETIVRDLARLLPGSTIRSVEVARPDLIDGDTPEGFAKKIRGKKIRSVVRRAKNTVMDLGGTRLLVNLGMTGRMLVARAGDEDATHLGVRLGLDTATDSTPTLLAFVARAMMDTAFNIAYDHGRTDVAALVAELFAKMGKHTMLRAAGIGRSSE
jgi:formamidopyrimidine-DNA glycosylase